MKSYGRMREEYILAISTTWPPMAAGSGRAFRDLVSGVDSLVVLVPKTEQSVDDPSYVKHVLRFAGQAGGPFKIYTILQHIEAVLSPFVWCLMSGKGYPKLLVACPTLFVGFGCWLLNLLTGIPYVVYAMGEEFMGPLTRRSLLGAKFYLTRWIVKRASAVVSISNFLKQVLYQDYGVDKDKIHVIYPTVDTSERHVDEQKSAAFKRSLVGEKRVILMVGRLASKRKGFDKAILSLPSILDEVADVKLVIVGPGDQTELKLLVQQVDMQDNVLFTGEVSRQELLLIFASCDVFLLPTRTIRGDVEGFGVVFLEANLMGKPVIGGYTGGTEDAIMNDQTGLLIDGNDVSQISRATKTLLKDSALAERLGSAGRERVLKEFDVKSQQERFLEVVNSIFVQQNV
jgi:phosphatidyl-myo-inositol dimannoside synthase